MRKFIFLILSLFIVYILFTTVSIILYSKKDEKRSSDVAIILGAGTSNGELSPVYCERFRHGIWLYENGYVKALIMTGGYGENQTVSDARAAMDYAIEQGVPEYDIFIEEQSTITQENIAFSKTIMDENGFETAIIVSDPLHMKRAMLMAKDHGITAYSSPTPTSAYKSMKTKIPFLIREEFFYVGYKFYRIFIMPFQDIPTEAS